MAFVLMINDGSTRLKARDVMTFNGEVGILSFYRPVERKAVCLAKIKRSINSSLEFEEIAELIAGTNQLTIGKFDHKQKEKIYKVVFKKQ